MMFQFLSSHHMVKKSPGVHIIILFMSDLICPASHNTVSFDFFTVHEIHSILYRDHVSVTSCFFVSVLKLLGYCIHESEWIQ